MKKAIYKNQKFGRWTIIRETPKVGKHRKFLCECSCDRKTVKEVYQTSLVSGKSTSCGCYRDEVAKVIHLTHGLSQTVFHRILKDMKRRCYNKKFKHYKNYGGRGIGIFDEWRGKNGLENFYLWNTSLPKNEQYKKGLQIDRKNNDGNYEPDNCRWVTGLVNANNTRDTTYVKYKGVMRSFRGVYDLLNNGLVSYDRAIKRYKLGWSLIKAITKKRRFHPNQLVK